MFQATMNSSPNVNTSAMVRPMEGPATSSSTPISNRAERPKVIREWEHPLSQEALGKLDYHFEMSAAGQKYSVTATPKEVGKGGRRSFYMDETGVIRATDRAGAPATVNDPPID